MLPKGDFAFLDFAHRFEVFSHYYDPSFLKLGIAIYKRLLNELIQVLYQCISFIFWAYKHCITIILFDEFIICVSKLLWWLVVK